MNYLARIYKIDDMGNILLRPDSFAVHASYSVFGVYTHKLSYRSGSRVVRVRNIARYFEKNRIMWERVAFCTEVVD